MGGGWLHDVGMQSLREVGPAGTLTLDDMNTVRRRHPEASHDGIALHWKGLGLPNDDAL